LRLNFSKSLILHRCAGIDRQIVEVALEGEVVVAGEEELHHRGGGEPCDQPMETVVAKSSLQLFSCAASVQIISEGDAVSMGEHRMS